MDVSTPTPSAAVSPLRQRMLDDMRMRKFGEKTQLDYVRAVRSFTKYLGRSPETASGEDLRNYQLHLVDHGNAHPEDVFIMLGSMIAVRDGTFKPGDRISIDIPARSIKMLVSDEVLA